jgi:hypothetical protein
VSGSRALPPRWLPQYSCVVIENSFDPDERLQAPGSLWLNTSLLSQFYCKNWNWKVTTFNLPCVKQIYLLIKRLLYSMTILSKFGSNWATQRFQTRRFLCEFSIRSYVKLSSAVGAIMFEGPNRRTHFCGMILGWPPSKIVSGVPDFQPRWPPS